MYLHVFVAVPLPRIVKVDSWVNVGLRIVHESVLSVVVASVTKVQTAHKANALIDTDYFLMV